VPSPATRRAIRRPRAQRVRELASASRERRVEEDQRTVGEAVRDLWRVGVDTTAGISVVTTSTRGIVATAAIG
jgi:hypothetical protein